MVVKLQNSRAAVEERRKLQSQERQGGQGWEYDGGGRGTHSRARNVVMVEVVLSSAKTMRRRFAPSADIADHAALREGGEETTMQEEL